MIHGTPFDFGGNIYVFTSIAVDAEGGTEMEAYRLVKPDKFGGGEPSEKNGWRHGEKIIFEGRQFLLQGPPAIFEAEPVRPAMTQSYSTERGLIR
jgi:hypothetical protein